MLLPPTHLTQALAAIATRNIDSHQPIRSPVQFYALKSSMSLHLWHMTRVRRNMLMYDAQHFFYNLPHVLHAFQHPDHIDVHHVHKQYDMLLRRADDINYSSPNPFHLPQVTFVYGFVIAALL